MMLPARRWWTAALVLCLGSEMRAVEAFQLVNGQMVTDGFSIINSPQPNTLDIRISQVCRKLDFTISDPFMIILSYQWM